MSHCLPACWNSPLGKSPRHSRRSVRTPASKFATCGARASTRRRHVRLRLPGSIARQPRKGDARMLQALETRAFLVCRTQTRLWKAAKHKACRADLALAHETHRTARGGRAKSNRRWAGPSLALRNTNQAPKMGQQGFSLKAAARSDTRRAIPGGPCQLRRGEVSDSKRCAVRYTRSSELDRRRRRLQISGVRRRWLSHLEEVEVHVQTSKTLPTKERVHRALPGLASALTLLRLEKGRDAHANQGQRRGTRQAARDSP